MIHYLQQLVSPFFSYRKKERIESKFKNDDEKALYEKIFQTLKEYTQPRLDHSMLSPDGGQGLECELNFFYSKSWKVVLYKYLINIESEDPQVNDWVEKWKKRIHKIEDSQVLIQNRTKKIKKCHRILVSNEIKLKHFEESLKGREEFSDEKGQEGDELAIPVAREKYRSNLQNFYSYEREIAEANHLITQLLDEGKQTLESNDSVILTTCSKVIDYMKENWVPLSESTRHPELHIGVDDEKIHMNARIGTPQNNETKTPLNGAHPAIFIIKQDIATLLVSDQFGESHNLVYPIEIGIKNKFLLGEVPLEINNKEAKEDVDFELLYNISYDISYGKPPKKKKVSESELKIKEMTIKIKEFVDSAIKEINATVSKSNNSTVSNYSKVSNSL